MKTVIHTLRYGSAEWLDTCAPTLENWCKRHGYPLTVWGETKNPEKYPNSKFAAEHLMLEMFVRSDADRLIYVDADVWLHPEAPAFPELEGLAMASDGMHREHNLHWREWCQTNFKFVPKNFDYSNAGVFSITRKDAEIFLKFFKPPFIEEFMDQHHFCYAACAARDAGMTFTRLDSVWNLWARDLNPGWAVHAWGTDKMRDLETRRELGLLDLKPNGRTFCFMPPGFPAQDKTIVCQFVDNCGLGNQCFEAAAALHLGDRLKLPVIFAWKESQKREFGLGAFGIGALPFKQHPIVSARLGQGNLAIVDHAAQKVHDSTERFPAVSHPFQAEECFAPVADKVRELFKLEPFDLKVPEGRTPVAIQARRGDYVKHPRLNVTTPGYFLNGIDYIRHRIAHPHFYVISDDPDWCRQQFGHLPDVTVMPPQDPVDGLRVMVACKAAVISNSTFGWWGAWLSGVDLVVVPERWHNGGKFYGDWKPAPDRWHRVPVTRKIEKKPMVSLPPPPVNFREYPQEFERAIVIPWHSKGDKWHSLRFCLRSIHQNFTDKQCPIVVLGTSRPPWLLFSKHRVRYIEAWSYQDALMQGTQIAGEVVWMNDDIALLQPTGWEDLRRPFTYGPFPPELLEDFRKRPNPWRVGVLKAVEKLGPEALNFSCHVPYLFERDKVRQIFEEFGVQHKMPLETLYYNRFGVAPKVVNGERTMEPEFGSARFLNYTDAKLSPELKKAIAEKFPEFAPWELKIPITV